MMKFTQILRFLFFFRVFQKMFYQAPSPQRKKEPAPKENKIRLFLKRSSEPLLNLQNAAQQVIAIIAETSLYLYFCYSLINNIDAIRRQKCQSKLKFESNRQQCGQWTLKHFTRGVKYSYECSYLDMLKIEYLIDKLWFLKILI